MNIYQKNELTCKPLDTYSEVLTFLQNPPAWRSLCKELTPHSDFKLKNQERTNKSVSRILSDGPESFCHFDPDAAEPERYPEKSLPKTLVCHDMANGYHDDSIIDGTCNYDAYTFYNWAGVDIFCYFSHHLVTIPPLGWINVGHAHGVKVIGTVITEWAEGIEFWDQILETEAEYKNFASALVAIAKTLKFDGWLLNVENKVAKPEVLLQFVRHLHSLLHQELTEPVLVWYDSVTIDGHLNWQNALNSKNKAFFDACDGFFTNYSWKPVDIESSVQVAGDRVTDLFIGIDVWGRNFYGGGQFNTQEAVDLAHLNGCSLAIFAPAWTHEAMASGKSDANLIALDEALDPYEHFLLRDRALWDSIWRYLNTRLPCALPFRTSFCRGQGLTRRLYGEVISPGSWYNLRHMQYQPNASHGPHGYLLSTMDNIINASRTVALKDPNGIIRYREAPRSYIELKEEPKSLETVNIVPKADSVGVLEEEPVDPTVENDVGGKPNPTLKRKLQNVFKHIFRHSKTKKEGERKEDDHENRLENSSHQNVESKDADLAQKREVTKLEAIPEQTSEPELVATKSNANQSGNKEEKEGSFGERDHENKTEIVAFANSHEERPATDDEAGEDEPMISSGRSMVRMSVNIQLKDKEDKTRYGLACVPDELQCLQVLYEDSFIGGSCLQINPSDEHSRDHRQIRILHCDFPCEHSLIFCVVTKHVVGHEEQFLNVKVRVRRSGGAEQELVLVGRDVPQAAPAPGPLVSLAPLAAAPGHRFQDLRRYMLLHQPDFYVPVENSFDWIVRYYEVQVPNSRVTSINGNTGLSHGPILLGYLGICAKNKESESHSSIASS